MDKEIFTLVFEKSSPHLTRNFWHWFSKVIGYKQYAIGYALLGYRIQKYFLSDNTYNLSQVIMQGITYYNEGINSFKTMSTLKRFESQSK